MAWTPISNTVPQYSKNAGGAAASGYFLKFYADGTTTPINMATDSAGGTTLAKCQLDTLGYPINGSGDVFIPHIDQDYKLALYENATDADNNTLASAAWVVDGLKPSASNLAASNGTSLITHTQSGTDYNLDTYLQNRYVVSVDEFGAVGDGVADDTSALDNAVARLNSTAASVLICGVGKTYKYNGTGMKVASNKTVDGRGSTFVTDSASLCWLTEGTYDNHRENIHFINIRITGFADPIQILFADSSSVSQCYVENCSNIGIQVKGDDLVGNVIERNHVKNPGFHCYATNDSTNYDPSHTDQGLRYPRDTTFRDNVAEGATLLAYNAHSTADGGMTRVYGGEVRDCTLIGKNSFGSQIWDGMNIVDTSTVDGTNWVWEIGVSQTTGDENAMCIVKNITYEYSSRQSLFLIRGNCSIKDITITSNATANKEITLWQLQNIEPLSVVDIDEITVNGNAIQYAAGPMFNGAGTSQFVDKVNVSNITFNAEVSCANTSDDFFKFDTCDIGTLNIHDIELNTASGGALGRFIYTPSSNIENLYIDRVYSKNTIHQCVFPSGTINNFKARDNENIGLDNRYAGIVDKSFRSDNLPRNKSVEATGATSGTATVLVGNFEAGAEYEVDISTDRSNSGTTFLSRSVYSVLVSRDGLGLTSALLYNAGSDANIAAQFQISGADIEFWTAFATTYYVNVTKVNDR